MSRIAFVTGANQGLGFALVKGLARTVDSGDVVYLTGRDPERVRGAAERVHQSGARVRGRVLDVRDGGPVKALADELAAEHGGVDTIFSNAAARLTPATPWAELVDPSLRPTTSARRESSAPSPLSFARGDDSSWSRAASARCANCRTPALPLRDRRDDPRRRRRDDARLARRGDRGTRRRGGLA